MEWVHSYIMPQKPISRKASVCTQPTHLSAQRIFSARNGLSCMNNTAQEYRSLKMCWVPRAACKSELGSVWKGAVRRLSVIKISLFG